MKNILITGASRGIGKFLYDSLSKKYNVIGISKNPIISSKYKIFKCNVENFEEIEKTFDIIKKEIGDIYSLINCAGVLSTGLLVTHNQKNIDEMIDVNLKGTIYCSKKILKSMFRCGEGRIINFSSIASFSAIEGDSIYSATKAAINIFTKSLAKEVEKKKITVNAIAPGLVSTDMTKNLTVEQKKNLINKHTIKSEIPLLEILNTVDFLLSDKSQYISGEVIKLG